MTGMGTVSDHCKTDRQAGGGSGRYNKGGITIGFVGNSRKVYGLRFLKYFKTADYRGGRVVIDIPGLLGLYRYRDHHRGRYG